MSDEHAAELWQVRQVFVAEPRAHIKAALHILSRNHYAALQEGRIAIALQLEIEALDRAIRDLPEGAA